MEIRKVQFRAERPLAGVAIAAACVLAALLALPFVVIGAMPDAFQDQRMAIAGVIAMSDVVVGLIFMVVVSQTFRGFAATALALRRFNATRETPCLSTTRAGAGGRLMRDAQQVMMRLDQALQHLDKVDPLTGARSLSGLLQELVHREDGKQVIVAIRVENIEKIADKYDQGTAEYVLKVLHERMHLLWGRDIQLARTEGRDFLTVRNAAQPSAGHDEKLAFELRNQMIRLSEPIAYYKANIAPHLSAAIATVGPDVEASVHEAIRILSLTSHRMPIAVDTPEARKRLETSFVLEKDLRKALHQDQLELHYQPVFDLRQGRAIGAEALVRWNSPERGMVSPGAFVPLAEASGLIAPMGRWVLRRACRDVAQWPEDRRVAINICATQFLDPDLPLYVQEAADEAGICPARLEIELTETVAMVDHEYTYRTFSRLRDMGVHILLDDFGTGYASLSTLHKLPFDTIKIDREFVTEVQNRPASRAICASLLALGGGLGVNVLAEGTETAQEVDTLAQMGCRYFQGFHFSRPVPLAEVEGVFAALSDKRMAG